MLKTAFYVAQMQIASVFWNNATIFSHDATKKSTNSQIVLKLTHRGMSISFDDTVVHQTPKDLQVFPITELRRAGFFMPKYKTTVSWSECLP